MSWGEAFRLALILIADPSSQVGAATGGLAQPVSREYMALQILVDNAVQQAAKKRAQLRTLPDPFKRTKRIWRAPPLKDGIILTNREANSDKRIHPRCAARTFSKSTAETPTAHAAGPVQAH